MKVCFVAGPLIARTGVYRSAFETVKFANSKESNFSLILAVSSRVTDTGRFDSSPPWYTELLLEPDGVSGVRRLREMLLAEPEFVNSDVVISLTPQTDMAMATMQRKWVAFVRGRPWPGVGETHPLKRFAWSTLEKLALSRASAVWATTPILRAELPSRLDVKLVPAGVAPVTRRYTGQDNFGSRVVWAARYSVDKNPFHVLKVFRTSALLNTQCVMFGSGPLQYDLEDSAPSNVEVAGFVEPGELWSDAFVYIGTSHREGFGRSAVEAAMAGLPVVLSRGFGCASLLYTDAKYSSLFVLDDDDVAGWSNAIVLLRDDPSLRRAVARHVHENARALSIDVSVRKICDGVGS